MSSAFVQAAVILLREGLEAMLVIAALAGYLRKSGSAHRISALYSGALAAIVASFITAWVFISLYAGQHNDLLEGFVILFAAALMLYVSGWLYVKQDGGDVQAMFASKADTALAQNTGFAVAALAFLAVFREGAETVLFVLALASSEGGFSSSIWAGLAAAAVGLAVLFYFINIITQRIPLRPLFIATSAFLFLMAIKFIGEGLVEFQETNFISFTEIPSIAWLAAYGVNPSVEALSIQFLVILASVASCSIFLRNNSMHRKAAAKARH